MGLIGLRILAVVLFGMLPAAVAGPLLFDGQTVQISHEYPALGTTVGIGPLQGVVGSGVEFPNFSAGAAAVNFSDTNIWIDFFYSGTFTQASFNGFHVSDVNGLIPAFALVAINPATTFPGLDNSRIAFDQDNIWVNFEGLSWGSGTNVVSLDVTATPEPSTFALAALGALLGFGLTLRRRTRESGAASSIPREAV